MVGCCDDVLKVDLKILAPGYTHTRMHTYTHMHKHTISLFLYCLDIMMLANFFVICFWQNGLLRPMKKSHEYIDHIKPSKH